MLLKHKYLSCTNFQLILQQYLETKIRFNETFDHLVYTLSMSKQHKLWTVYRNILYESISKRNDMIRIFKFGILVQRCILDGEMADGQKVIEMLIYNCLEKIKNKENEGLDTNSAKFFKSKIVLPYLHYLQRRIHDKLEHKFEMNKDEQLSLKSIFQNMSNAQREYYTKLQKLQQAKVRENLQQGESISIQQFEKYMQECYYLINLIKKAVGMNGAILALVRYYGGRFGWILDFNIGMGRDLEGLYNRLSGVIKSIEKYYEIKRSKDVSIGETEGTLRNIQILMKEVERINEQLYIIYNNGYNCRNLQKYVPTFINTQKYLFHTLKIRSQNNLGRRHSYQEEKQNILMQTLILVSELTEADENQDSMASLRKQKGQGYMRHRRINTDYNKNSFKESKNREDLFIQPQQQEQISNNGKISLENSLSSNQDGKGHSNDNETTRSIQSDEDKLCQSPYGKKCIKEDLQILLEMSKLVENMGKQ